MPSFRQVGHCNFALFSQPGVSQVPKVDIFDKTRGIWIGSGSGYNRKKITRSVVNTKIQVM